MGERLCINVLQGEELLANVYFHWKSNTFEALEATYRVMIELDRTMLKNNVDVNLAVQALGCLGAKTNNVYAEPLGIPTEFCSDFEDRNIGIIDTEESRMTANEEWSEMVVDIDVSGKSCIANLEDCFHIQDDEKLLEEFFPSDEFQIEKDNMTCSDTFEGGISYLCTKDVANIFSVVNSAEGSIIFNKYYYIIA